MHKKYKYIHREDIKYNNTGNGWTLVSASVLKNYVNAKIGGVGALIWTWDLNF